MRAESLITLCCASRAWRTCGLVSQWPILGTTDRRDVSYGGFIGYNTQWENVILGVEPNYNPHLAGRTGLGLAGAARRPGDGPTV